jgi:hypothetical protein
MKRPNLDPLISLIALAFVTVGCGVSGGGGAPVTPSASVELPEMIGASHNRFVGTYTATSTLPDGRTVRYDLYTRPDSKFSFYALVDGIRLASNLGMYDIRNGILTGGAGIALADGKTTVSTTSNITSLPFGASGALGIGVSRHDSLAKPPTSSTSYVTFKRVSPAPLGDDRIVRVTDPSADCNADPKAERFEFLQSKYNVPYTKQGDFYAEGSLIQAPTSRKGFNFVLNGLNRTDADSLVRVGGRVDFPNEKAQFNYFEYPGDGTVHQWSAISGALVFDAIDPTGANYSIGGIDYESDAGVTFHLENVRMEARDNSASGNTPIRGAKGSFTAKFSGTTTVGYKKASR